MSQSVIGLGTIESCSLLVAGPSLAAPPRGGASPGYNQARGRRYISAMSRLDAGVQMQEATVLADAFAAINAEFAGLALDQRPFGFVQKCVLGPGFEVHILDIRETPILTHYRFGQRLPDPFEQGRILAVRPGHLFPSTYLFVEIHSDRIVAVSADGAAKSAPVR